MFVSTFTMKFTGNLLQLTMFLLILAYNIYLMLLGDEIRFIKRNLTQEKKIKKDKKNIKNLFHQLLIFSAISCALIYIVFPIVPAGMPIDWNFICINSPGFLGPLILNVIHIHFEINYCHF